MENSDVNSNSGNNTKDTLGDNVNNKTSENNESQGKRFRSFRIPVRAGEEHTVKIEAMSKRGDSGVAKIEGMVIFVAGTKVGEEVRIRIKRVGLGYAVGETMEQVENEDKDTE
ncbi:MAG: TRAM domain-containing protein [Nitrososphaeraceae archaeon]